MTGETVNSSPAENGDAHSTTQDAAQNHNTSVAEPPQVDEFGLPIRKPQTKQPPAEAEEPQSGDGSDSEAFVDAPAGPEDEPKSKPARGLDLTTIAIPEEKETQTQSEVRDKENDSVVKDTGKVENDRPQTPNAPSSAKEGSIAGTPKTKSPTVRRSGAAVSEWSHMHAAPKSAGEVEEEDEGEWQTMPAYAPFDIYDDNNKLIAKEVQDDDEDETLQYGTLGGAGKGYTRVQLDEDAQSATSMDDNTAYLFKDVGKGTNVAEEDEEVRDAVGQMQATKDLLTEGQRIAYVGTVRLTMIEMLKDIEVLERTKPAKKAIEIASASLLMWSQKTMLRLYAHMEIGHDEQIMIEQLAEHGVQASDLTPALMNNARIKNPGTDGSSSGRSSLSTVRQSVSSPGLSVSTPRPSVSSPGLSVFSPRQSVSSPRQSVSSPGLSVSSSRQSVSSPGLGPSSPSTARDALHSPGINGSWKSIDGSTSPRSVSPRSGGGFDPPPPYSENDAEDFAGMKSPSDFGDAPNIDIDIRWTVLCDLFLILVADSTYDSRSRRLLEKVGEHLQVSWLDICRFEKRVTDALEMQEAADKENWNEDEHMELRRKAARNRRLLVMGLATVGGSVVIGLSAGLLAPVIGAGLAAGFTTIGVAGTSGFLAGAGGAAIVTTTGVVTGGTIGVRAANRRTGAVKTFEYRPLHNNKRVNLIVTIAGWMSGKVDDVRLPFSTVDPIMGDIYSIFWEPEMLQSMGDTISILATEALTQTLQQVLGSTILITLMAALQLPVVLTKLAYLIDNPWNVSLARADLAGLILADSLTDRNLGSRPITLVGFSLGARVIYSCLRELAKKGQTGLIQNAYIFGAPVIANKSEFTKCRTVVSGRFLNGYATNDWILAYLFRITGGGIAKVAGLGPIDDVHGIENVNVTEWVPGHMSYRAAMPRLLREVGWEVESDEFTEIEDPDPDNHEKRQRELINEIEEARRQQEEKSKDGGKKGKFAFWRKKKAEKKEWETYDDRLKGGVAHDTGELKEGDLEKTAEGVLFDIDAIRAEVKELAGQDFEVKQLESTLPPMKITIDSPEPTPLLLRATKSHNDSLGPSPSTTAPSTANSITFPHHESPQFSPTTNESSEITMTFDMPSPKETDKPLPIPPLPLDRPALKSHSTAPVPTPIVNMRPEHNAWLDDEDDFGQEKEIQMTFA